MGLEERSHKGEKVKISELVEVKMKISILDKLLQEQEETYQWHGWKLRKKVTWPVIELYEGNIRHRLKEEYISEAKHGQRSISEEEKAHICEPKQGTVLHEDDESIEDEERPDECHMEWMKSVELKNRKMMGKETVESRDFEAKYWCVYASYIEKEDQLLAVVVKKKEEDSGVSQRDT